MPTLNWIGKEAVVRHHAEVPFRLLEEVPECSCPPTDGDTENLIVQGDNLEALKALLPRYAGQVKCIYIDPPYNTGNEGWVYNDAVNSPEIRQWLGQTVGKEAEDLSRHDKWLCMMYPRLVLLRQFLRDDGTIFVSIDDNEVGHLRSIMDEILGVSNFITTIIWEKNFSPKNDAKYLSESHDFILLYAKSKVAWRPNLLPRTEKHAARYQNPDNDPRGPWASSDLLRMEHRDNSVYSINSPSGKVWTPKPGTSWRHPKDEMDALIATNQIWFGKDGNTKPRRKRFLSEVREGIVPVTLWVHGDVGHTQEAKQELQRVVDESRTPFATPKPTQLIQRILQLASDKDSLILDSFAGSGTTGHAVLALNRQDGGNRRFILVEMDEKIARGITAERVRRVAQGYTNAKGEGVPGLGGGFQFARLGKPLFDETGAIRGDVKFPELAEFVFFKETGRPLPKAARGQRKSPLLGAHDGRAVYLLFNGILGDRSINGGNVLTGPVLAQLPAHNGPKVIYAAACRLGRARLDAGQITFKQTPYDLQVS